jgi:hypothetical protein
MLGLSFKLGSEKKRKEKKIVDKVSEVATNCLLQIVLKQMTWCG